jgi:hypothetical protein
MPRVGHDEEAAVPRLTPGPLYIANSRGGRKLIMTPEGVATPARKPRRDETLVRALVRAHRWRRRIESGQAKSITDLAEQEAVTDAYVCRLMPLTCLAPDLVEAILEGWGAERAEVAGMLQGVQRRCCLHPALNQRLGLQSHPC